MVREFNLSPSNFVLPIFIKEGLKKKQAVPSMPGVYRHSMESMIEECVGAVESGIPAVILFGVPQKKDSVGSEAYNPKGVIPRAVNAIKNELGDELLVICDVCLCEYTDHGHCAPVQANRILNDEGIKLYARSAVKYAKMGANVVAPSAMINGSVDAIRTELDNCGFSQTLILSYAVKYASSFYGPFRDVAESSVVMGPKDRKSYQLDPTNLSQIYREVELEIQEGADIIMVKPALPYLDVLRELSNNYPIPLAAYQVSGEYAMLKAAAQKGWIDERSCMLETLLAIRRAGANIIISYFAKEAVEALK